ncbi:unnamed protein product, partial [Iphiclides podalirius]
MISEQDSARTDRGSGQRPWERSTNLRISELVGRCAGHARTRTPHAHAHTQRKPDALMNGPCTHSLAHTHAIAVVH